MTERWSPETPKVKPEQTNEQEVQNAPKNAEKGERTSTHFREEFEQLKSTENTGSRESGLRGLARDVEDRQNVLESSARDEKGKLDAVRANLGIEQGEAQNTHSDRANGAETEALKSLRDDIDQELRQGKEGKESAEHIVRIRRNVGEIGNALQSFTNEIRRRDQDRLDPLFDARAFSSLQSGFNNLRTIAEGTGDFSQEDLASTFGQITRGLEQMGETGRGNPDRDYENNLSRLSARARGIADALDTLRRGLRNGDELIAGTARRLSESADNASVVASSLRSRQNRR
jgi:uncharacterized protein YukE